MTADHGLTPERIGVSEPGVHRTLSTFPNGKVDDEVTSATFSELKTWSSGASS